MSQDRLLAIGAGIASALLLVAALTSLPAAMLFLYVVPLPLFLAGLGLGLSGAVAAGLAGSAVALAAAGLVAGLGFALAFAAPAGFVVRHVLLSRTAADGKTEWYPPGLLAGWLALFASLAIAGAMIVMYDDQGGLEGAIERSLPLALERLTGSAPPPDLLGRIETWAAFLPAMMGSVWVCVMALNASVAQSVLVRFGRARRPSPDLAAVETPGWFLYALAGALLASIAGPDGVDFLGRNLAVVLAMPYFFVGLGVVHVFARRLPARTMVLTIFYILLILLGLIAMLAMAALGVAEQFIHLRRRVTGPGAV